MVVLAGNIEKSLWKTSMEYSRYLRAKGRSPVTISAYEGSIRALPASGEITRECIEAHIDGLWARLKPASVQHHHKNLRAFFNWCVAKGHLEVSPMAGVPEPRVQPSIVEPFTPDQVRALFAVARTSRDRAIVAVFLNTGIRLGELVALRPIDVQMGRLRIKGKGNRWRWVGISESTSGVLLAAMRESDETYGTIFAVKNKAVYWALRRLAGRAGVPHAHPHRFRDTFAVRFLENGGGVDDLQILMGHASIHMTLRYVMYGREMRAIQGHARYAPSVL